MDNAKEFKNNKRDLSKEEKEAIIMNSLSKKYDKPEPEPKWIKCILLVKHKKMNT